MSRASTRAFYMLLAAGPGSIAPDIGAVLFTRLKHWWPLDEVFESGLTTQFKDVHGGHHLTMVNSAAGITFGGPTLRSGGLSAPHFSGTARALNTIPEWMATDRNHGIAAWVQPDTTTVTGVTRPVIADSNNDDSSEAANYTTYGYLSEAGRPATFWEYGVGLDAGATAGVEHVATGGAPSLVTFGRDTTLAKTFLGVNAVAQTVVGYSNGPTGGTKSSKRLTIGNKPTGDSPLLGRVQDVAIFDRPLTNAERAWLYNEGAGRGYADLAGAGGVFRFFGGFPDAFAGRPYDEQLPLAGPYTTPVTIDVVEGPGELPPGLTLELAASGVHARLHGTTDKQMTIYGKPAPPFYSGVPYHHDLFVAYASGAVTIDVADGALPAWMTVTWSADRSRITLGGTPP